LLEIMFRLEQEFGIEIARGELFPDSIFRIDPEWFLDGKLTDNGLAELRSRLPFADLSSKTAVTDNMADKIRISAILLCLIRA
jgi:acyl carrier protein